MRKEVYHEGELKVQRLLGEDLMAARNGRGVAESIVRGAIKFIEKQPMAVVGSADVNGRIWASVLIGDFGFVTVPNPNSLRFFEDKIRSAKSDVFFKNIDDVPAIGSLFIELARRARYRVNGDVSRAGGLVDVSIKEAYPNCPKYIQRRIVSMPEHIKQTDGVTSGGHILGDDQINWIRSADTFFVASSGPDNRLDVSHRGGNQGFVDVLSDGTLKVPDYQGNSMYNTFGNFVTNPNAGIVFVDFEKGATLQLTGKAELLFDQTSDDDLEKTTGTGRFFLFHPEEWIQTDHHHDVNWEFVDYSPFNP